MVSVDMCEHNWPGSGCRDCAAKYHRYAVGKMRDGTPTIFTVEEETKNGFIGRVVDCPPGVICKPRHINTSDITFCYGINNARKLFREMQEKAGE